MVFRTQWHSEVSGGVETIFWFWQTQWKQQPFIWRTFLAYAEPPWCSTNLLIWPEIRLVAMKQLANTFLTVGNNSSVHREYSYCRQIKPTCTDGNTVEGTVTLWLPGVWPVQTLTPFGQNLDKKTKFPSWDVRSAVARLKKRDNMPSTTLVNKSLCVSVTWLV